MCAQKKTENITDTTKSRYKGIKGLDGDVQQEETGIQSEEP